MKIQPCALLLTTKNSAKSKTLPKAGALQVEVNFCSKLSSDALKTNLYVLNSIKNPKKQDFSLATKEDYEILTAKDFKAPLRRVKWFNPKDGKVYWLLKNGRTKEDNGWNIRILNENGLFLKNAQIEDRNIVIADDFSPKKKKSYTNTFALTDYFPHGSFVLRFAMVNNPFATYDIKDIITGKGTTKYIDKNNDDTFVIDEISYSWGHEVPNSELKRFPKKGFENIMPTLLSIDYENLENEDAKLSYIDIDDTVQKVRQIDSVTECGPKFFVSSGNEGKDYFNFILLSKGVEGVGSLNANGKISDFSSSRNIDLTKHYELGEYKIVRTKDGFNHTGGDWTDVICNFKSLFPLEGKSAEGRFVSDEDYKALDNEPDLKKRVKNFLTPWEKQGKLLPRKLVVDDDEFVGGWADENIFYSVGDWVPYTINEKGILEAYVERLCGTSFSTPIRAARYALNDAMEGIL